MGATTANIGHLPARVAGIMKKDGLEQHCPDPLISQETKISSATGLHARVNEFYKAEILAARTRVGLPSADLVVLDLAPNSFGDFPLSELLEDNYVIGADINAVAMENAKTGLSEEKQEHLTLLQVDASLAANEIIQSVRDMFFEYPTLTDGLFWELYNRMEEMAFSRRLPFVDNSINMVVAISAFSSFVVEAINAIIPGIMWGKYGKKPSYDFLSEQITFHGRKLMRGELINRASNRLYHRVVKHQLREIRRVLDNEGAAFLCDHAVVIPRDNFDGSFTLYSRDMISPSDQYLTDIGVRFCSGRTDFRVATRAEDVSVIGQDSLHAIARGVTGFKTVDEFYFWSVNSLGHYWMDVPAVYRLETGLLLQKA